MDIVDRAYQLARSGRYCSLSEIIWQLKSENVRHAFIEDILRGSVIHADLTRLCKEASSKKASKV